MSFLTGIWGKVIAIGVLVLSALGILARMLAKAEDAGKAKIERANLEQRERNREISDRIDSGDSDVDGARERLRRYAARD